MEKHRIRSAAAAAALTVLLVFTATGCGSPDQQNQAKADTICVVNTAPQLVGAAFTDTLKTTAHKHSQTIVDVAVPDATTADVLAEAADGRCATVLAVGNSAAKNAARLASEHRNIDFVGFTTEKMQPATNFKPVRIRIDQGAFQAGYFASGITKTGVMAVVTDSRRSMLADGFYEGVQFYNQAKGSGVEVLGYNPALDTPVTPAKELVPQLAASQADLFVTDTAAYDAQLLPLLKKRTGGVVWSGEDGFDSRADLSEFIATSVVVNMSVPLEEICAGSENGNLSVTPVEVSAANGGIQIAPFHNFDGRVSKSLRSELDQIASQLKSGKILIPGIDD
ncbi:MAG: hypothetical protein SOS98_01470 [Varibaculum sp.]|nr:hypothetical protein [Varibaculum sp.]